MLKYIFVFSFVISIAISMGNIQKSTFQVDDAVVSPVLELNQNNFLYEIMKNNFILVEFYAPWCSFCQDFELEYMRLAAYLDAHNFPVLLGRVDGSKYQQLRDVYNIQKYPTLKLFRFSTPIDYHGNRHAGNILNWLKMNIHLPVKMLTTLKDVGNFIGEHDIGIIGFYENENSPKARSFLTVASRVQGFPFAICNNKEACREYKAKDGDIAISKKNNANVSFVNK